MTKFSDQVFQQELMWPITLEANHKEPDHIRKDSETALFVYSLGPLFKVYGISLIKQKGSLGAYVISKDPNQAVNLQVLIMFSKIYNH